MIRYLQHHMHGSTYKARGFYKYINTEETRCDLGKKALTLQL